MLERNFNFEMWFIQFFCDAFQQNYGHHQAKSFKVLYSSSVAWYFLLFDNGWKTEMENIDARLPNIGKILKENHKVC